MTDGAGSEVWKGFVSAGDTTVPGVVGTAAATEHGVNALALGVRLRGTVITAIIVLAPFIYVARHVVKAELVGGFRLHGMISAAAVAFIVNVPPSTRTIVKVTPFTVKVSRDEEDDEDDEDDEDGDATAVSVPVREACSFSLMVMVFLSVS